LSSTTVVDCATHTMLLRPSLATTPPPSPLSSPSLHAALPICAELGLADLSEANVLVIVNKVGDTLTANLQGPLVIHANTRVAARSEEHTSELQSHLNLVCRLLLEKKKNRTELNLTAECKRDRA